MKIHALATLAFITANGVKAQVVENPCVICPNGATAGDDIAPGADVGVLTTCKELIETAPLFETGTLSCAQLMGFMNQRAAPPLFRTPAPYAPMGSLSLMISPPAIIAPTLLKISRSLNRSLISAHLWAHIMRFCAALPPLRIPVTSALTVPLQVMTLFRRQLMKKLSRIQLLGVLLVLI
jgi:hypothetical protein